jgi:hypothetical protein
VTATRRYPDDTLPLPPGGPQSDGTPALRTPASRYPASQDGVGVLPGKGVRAVSCPSCLRPLPAPRTAPDATGGTPAPAPAAAPCAICRAHHHHEAMPAWLLRWTRWLGR